MVRRPWLRRTRLLAGAPIMSASASSTPLGEGADDLSARAAGTTFELGFLGDFGPANPVVALAGSRRTLGDPMRGEC